MAKANKSELVQKDVKLIGKDFGELRKNLIDNSCKSLILLRKIELTPPSKIHLN